MLTNEQIEILRKIKSGADIYDYMTAKILRTIEKNFPSLICITKPMMYQGDGTDQMPYFGAILTKDGKKAIKEGKP